MFLASMKWEPAFISKGFTYWKRGPKTFKKHEVSDCHCDAIDALVVLPRCMKDVGDLHNASREGTQLRNAVSGSSECFLTREGCFVREAKIMKELSRG
jgi:hypothetical protein